MGERLSLVAAQTNKELRRPRCRSEPHGKAGDKSDHDRGNDDRL